MLYISLEYTIVQLDEFVRFRDSFSYWLVVGFFRLTCFLLVPPASNLFCYSHSISFFSHSCNLQTPVSLLNLYKFNISHLVLRCAYFTDLQPNLANGSKITVKNTGNAAHFFFHILLVGLFRLVGAARTNWKKNGLFNQSKYASRIMKSQK